MSAFSGNRLQLCWLMTSPAVENTLSAGTEVAVMQRSFWAIHANVVKCSAFFLHYSRDEASELSVGSLKNLSISSFFPLVSSS